MRVFTILLLVVNLTACSVVTDSYPEIPLEFNCKMDVSYNGADLLYGVDYSYGNLELTILEPEIFNGLKVNIDSESIAVSEDTLCLSYDTEMLASMCPLINLFDALEYINSAKPQIANIGEFAIMKFTINSKEYEAFLQKGSFKLVKLIVEDCNFVFYY